MNRACLASFTFTCADGESEGEEQRKEWEHAVNGCYRAVIRRLGPNRFLVEYEVLKWEDGSSTGSHTVNSKQPKMILRSSFIFFFPLSFSPFQSPALTLFSLSVLFIFFFVIDDDYFSVSVSLLLYILSLSLQAVGQ